MCRLKYRLLDEEGADIMRFKGKSAWWFCAIIIGAALLLIPMIIFSAFIDRNIPALIMVLTLFSAPEIFCIPITFHNFAELQTETLLIVFGFIKKAIPYSNIDALRATNNPSSSLGASLDRIEIKCSLPRSFSKPAHFLTVLLGRHPRLLLKYPAEIAQAPETQIIGDFLYLPV